ncbi:MAG TPA: ABC transporter permease [Gemmatimonadaceae bacterium]|nr:ABC transporter permease [Gemmatimonadaceae bacterium]
MKRLLLAIVRLFPAPFRRQFGDEMREQIALDYESARARGVIGTASFVATTAIDLCWTAAREHARPSWVAPYTPHTASGFTDMLSEWGTDIRRAARSLRRTPAFTAMAVGTLALAIGVNAGMFSVVNTVLLHPLPYAHTDRLMSITASAPGSDMPAEFGVSNEFYLQYRESKLIESVALYTTYTSTMRTADRVERIRMSSATNSLFATLGAQPVLGRLPSGKNPDGEVVISYAMWRTWFGLDSAIIGRAYDISSVKRTIVGVMGPAFRFPTDETMLWIAGEIEPKDVQVGRFGPPLVARVKPGTTPEALTRELNELAKRLPERFGGTPRYAKLIDQHRAVVRPLDQQLLGSVARPLWVLLGAVGIVLLIACANVANLFMVRTEGRQRDLAVRRAIGAARGQLIRFQMSEAAVVAGLAGVLAVVLAVVTLPWFLHAAPAGIPRLAQASVGPATILFTLGAAVFAGLACGAVPAIHASAPDLARLREGGRGSTRHRHFGRDGLVAGQTALALVLLIGSGLLIRSYMQMRNVDPGYTTKNIFTFQIAPERANLTDGPTFAQFDLDFMERLRALPGVQAVGLVENVPLDENVQGMGVRQSEKVDDPKGGPLVRYTFTAGDYFKAMDISVLKGTVFEDADQREWRGHAILSTTAANLLWPGEDPIGKRFKQDAAGDAWFTVIGVVEDVLQNSFREKPMPLVYLPLVGPRPGSWAISSPAYVVKSPRAEVIAADVRAVVKQMAPEAPMYRVYTMAGLAAKSMVQLSFIMLTLAVASALALVLGAVGLYGVLSYVVAERTREIGVRMALGAKAVQVRRMVVMQGTRVVLVGVTIGVVVALVSTKALGNLLFGVAAIDVSTFIAMSAAMLVVGLVASYLPARRASNVDPIESLRGT